MSRNKKSIDGLNIIYTYNVKSCLVHSMKESLLVNVIFEMFGTKCIGRELNAGLYRGRVLFYH